MKRIYQLTLLVALIATTLISCSDNGHGASNPAGQLKQGPDSYGFGYCTEDITNTIGVNGGVEYTLGAAVQMKAEDMLQYGDSIIGIRCGIGGAGKEFTVYITDDLLANDEDCILVKTVGDVDGKTWEFVELDKPLAISEVGDAFFAYSIKTAEHAIGYQPGGSTNRDWVYAGGWQMLASAGLPGKVCIQAIVKGGDYNGTTRYYAVNKYLEAPEMIVAGESQKMKCHVTNLGTTYMNNVTIDYTYGKQHGTVTANNIGLYYGQTAAIELPALMVEEPGTINIHISTYTKGQQEPHEIDATQTAVKSGSYPSAVLLEHFTGQGCVNCPTGAAAIKTAIGELTAEEQDRVVWVSHHAGYGSDIFTLAQSSSIATFFQVPGAPMALLNRSKAINSLGFVFVASQIKSDNLRDLLKISSVASIEIEHNYNEETKELQVTLKGDCPFLAPSLTLMVTQSGMEATQSGFTGLYTHNHAPRIFLSEAFGDVVNTVDGKYSKSYTCTIPDKVSSITCDPEQMEIVAFIATHNGSNYLNSPVLNAAKAPLINSAPAKQEQRPAAKNEGMILTAQKVK